MAAWATPASGHHSADVWFFGIVSVGFSTQDGTATSGAKYIPTNGVLTFGDGETSKTFSVEVVNTATAEGPETFSLNLSNPTGGATLTSPSNTVVTILNTNIGIAFASAANAFTEPSGPVPWHRAVECGPL